MSDYHRDISLRLHDIMENVGASDENRRLYQTIAKKSEILHTLNYSPMSVFIFGSYSEGTTTPGLQSDIDTLLCRDHIPVIENIRNAPPSGMSLLMIRDVNTPHGYVKLQAVNNGIPATVYNMVVNDQFDSDNRGRMCQKNVSQYHEYEEDYINERNGPAVTLSGTIISVDVVPAFRCSTIPEYANEWIRRRRYHAWPPRGLMVDMSKSGCFFVGVGHPFSDERHIEWRLSFSLQERQLMFSLNSVQHKCFILLKMIKKDLIETVVGESISSYHCKMCLFYVIENTSEEIWRPENLFLCTRLCLIELLKCVSNGKCPNFFLKEENMFDRDVHIRIQQRLVDVLRTLISDGPALLSRIKCDQIGDIIMEAVVSRPKEVTAESFPEEILRMGETSIELYKQALASGKEAVHNIRVMVVGHFGVGKTVLTRRLLGKDVNIMARDSTNGIEVHVRQCRVSLQDGQWSVLMNDETTENAVKRLAKLLSHQRKLKTTESVSSDSIVMGAESLETDAAREPTLPKCLDNLDRDIREDNETDNTEKDEEGTNTATGNTDIEEENTQLKTLMEIIQEANKPNLHEEEDYANLSIWDFAGQYAFYCTHQVFMLPRAVYLLVTDISKHIDNVVKEDECYFDSGASKACTISEFVEFWLNSIHCYCPSTRIPPVILIGTHADQLDQTKKDKLSKDYFEAMRTFLAEKDTKYNLANKEFVVDNTVVDPNIESLKQKILEVAKQQDSWGELIPASWIMLEKSLVDLRDEGLKIIKLTDIQQLNKASPLPLSTSDELQLFLRFQHELGNMLYFSDEGLQEHALLDPQWLMDAFKCIITAKMFCVKTHIYPKWKEFNDRGILKMDLVEEVWGKKKENESFYEHRQLLIGMLEKLDIITKPWTINEDGSHTKVEDFFFAPCVVKDKPPPDILKPCQTTHPMSTTILCFTFSRRFVPTTIFNRLLASSIAKWPISRQGEKYLLYWGCGIFDLADLHRMTLYFSQNVIHVWVTQYSKADPQPSSDVCASAKEYLDQKLRQITECVCQSIILDTFVKCPNSAVGSSGLLKWEDIMDNDEISCDNHDKRHILTKSEILRFWLRDTVSENICRGVKAVSLDVRTNDGHMYKKVADETLTQTVTERLAVCMGSVGVLISGNGLGTVFRVGSKYVMTAWHVVRDIIDPRKTGSRDYIRLEKDDVFINFNEDPFQQSPVSYHVDKMPAFIDENLDVAVLTVKEINGILPKPFILCKDRTIERMEISDVSFIGYGHPNSHKKTLDARCQLINPLSYGAILVQSALEYLSEKQDYYRTSLANSGKNPDLVDVSYQGVDNESRFVFNAFMEKGASGAPAIATKDPDALQVIGMLTHGLPAFLFELPKIVQSQFPVKYRVEMGTRMTHIYTSMCKHHALLAQDLFR